MYNAAIVTPSPKLLLLLLLLSRPPKVTPLRVASTGLKNGNIRLMATIQI
jgi:hypothetical protein